ncbi:MAG: nucleoside triphosphate pyrophosphohydrolase [Gammaproteobacteria bacterium]|jgi:ATP diphosphatase
MTNHDPSAALLRDLLAVMSRLRDPVEGCPWDLEQTFASIVPHTIEEAYEVADCIERGDLQQLPGELGDLLFQVVFYAQIAAEQDRFGFDDVVKAITDKLVVRHPHVFGEADTVDAAEQTRRWEAQKAVERRQRDATSGTLDDVPLGLPALTRARKLQQRASRVGFDWPDIHGVRDKVVEEFDEVEQAVAGADAQQISEELGDLLFACVNWARHLRVDPETALRAASTKFERRFAFIERALAGQGVELAAASLEQMDDLWDEAKRTERAGAGRRQKKRVR